MKMTNKQSREFAEFVKRYGYVIEGIENIQGIFYNKDKTGAVVYVKHVVDLRHDSEDLPDIVEFLVHYNGDGKLLTLQDVQYRGKPGVSKWDVESRNEIAAILGLYNRK